MVVGVGGDPFPSGASGSGSAQYLEEESTRRTFFALFSAFSRLARLRFLFRCVFGGFASSVGFRYGDGSLLLGGLVFAASYSSDPEIVTASKLTTF